MEIKKIREAMALTQAAFARRLGVAITTIARWESGKTKPSRLAAEKLARLAKQTARIER